MDATDLMEIYALKAIATYQSHDQASEGQRNGSTFHHSGLLVHPSLAHSRQRSTNIPSPEREAILQLTSYSMLILSGDTWPRPPKGPERKWLRLLVGG